MRKLLIYAAMGFTLHATCVLATTYTVVNSGFTFSPDSISVTLGDTVIFSLSASHNAVEVSQATWNANGSTSNGGFSFPLGGGTWVPAAAGTYYYVCSPHASFGMKGRVFVNVPTTTGNTKAFAAGTLKIFPDPVKDKVFFSFPGIASRFIVYDILGQEVYRESLSGGQAMVNLSGLKKGIYFAEVIAGEKQSGICKFIKE